MGVKKCQGEGEAFILLFFPQEFFEEIGYTFISDGGVFKAQDEEVKCVLVIRVCLQSLFSIQEGGFGVAHIHLVAEDFSPCLIGIGVDGNQCPVDIKCLGRAEVLLYEAGSEAAN